MLPVQVARALIAFENIEGDVAAMMFTRPALAIGEQRTADPLALVPGSRDEIGNMTILRASEKIGRRL